MSLIPANFLDSVAAVGVPDVDVPVRYIATAFLVGHVAESPSRKKYYYTFIVTNRHVVHPGRHLWIRFRSPLPDQEAPPFDVPSADPYPCPWIFHPDQDIDLAVLPLDSIQIPKALQPDRFLLLDRHAISRQDLSSSECNEGNEVFILGFPLGIAGTTQNDVIVRHGIIARIQDWYDNRSKNFLIDSSIYPGNSGGPVILKPVLWSANQRTKIMHSSLLGLVAAYLPYRDVATSQQTGNVRLVTEENSGLAEVIPIDYVIGLTGVISGVFDRAQGKAVTWNTIQAAVDDAAHAIRPAREN